MRKHIDVTPSPGLFPVKTISPIHNSMAYFVVEPGRSFHSVQEVFCDRPRLSIQGWYYHAKELPKHMEQASLSQLKKNNVGEHDFEGDFMPMIATAVDNDNDNGTDTDTMELTQEDKDFLAQYINKTDLRP